MKRAIFAVLALAASSLILTACAGEEKQVAQEASAGVPGLEVTNARLVLPPVTGNPGAVYFDIANNGERSIAIRNAEVTGAARAEMHEMSEWSLKEVMGEMGPLILQPGAQESFKPGARHVMAFELSPKLKAGGSTEVTLIAAGGKKATFPARIVAAGDDR